MIPQNLGELAYVVSCLGCAASASFLAIALKREIEQKIRGYRVRLMLKQSW